ncbi:pantoate--beta-alanine ligase [Conexibacter sp. DBS9H8]|uniref:pantoate--beta-alanine ligase n=1 Tax=Conexibacter sp. DBS9H8 TaxID=2937801 RepID=UPI00200CE600|nr:pantoate--beta-alanine ligase [Conexibacter sp. DBS9H8]
MRSVTTVADLRRTLEPSRRGGDRIGLVPTMGALHAGHLSLIARARASCDVVVVSLFVNPTQFNDGADLAAYPRSIDRDAELARGAGADILFAPTVAEVYPAGFRTTVSLSGLTEVLEGAQRGRGHFDGVSTVVTKLLNMVGPDVAFFGQKDAQQALVVAALVRDLNIPTTIETCPTVREADGLALSSRNVHLSPTDRERALALQRALHVADELISAGEHRPEIVLDAARAVLGRAGLEPEYLVLTRPDDLVPVTRIDGPVLALVAARVGQTRLIDNRLITPAPRPNRQVTAPC